MEEIKWIRSNMSIDYIDKDNAHLVLVENSGDLVKDFKAYADSFFDAGECVIHYLLEVAAEKGDIAKLDLWYYSMIYLYRQSLELLLKANIFKHIDSLSDKKNIVGEVRHDLEKGFTKLTDILNINVDGNVNAKWVLDYFSDISKIDRESDMFRYPFSIKLKPLFDEQTHISLEATHDNMNKAYDILNDIFNNDFVLKHDYKAFEPKLIIEGGSYYSKSVAGYGYDRLSFYPFFSSYKEVANFLESIILDKNDNKYFMPMCYLYRNAVELGLKRLIIEDSHLGSEKALKVLKKKKHSILGLWNSISDEVNKCKNDDSDDTIIEDVVLYINTFHNFDLNSDLFRYPCDKNMNSYFITSTDFDVKNVSECFQELCNFLDGVDGMLSEMKEYEADMRAEFGDF